MFKEWYDVFKNRLPPLSQLHSKYKARYGEELVYINTKTETRWESTNLDQKKIYKYIFKTVKLLCEFGLHNNLLSVSG